jgi:hypothetical protein
MKKTIRYRLPVSTQFPAGHPRKGKPTYFKDKIEMALGRFERCCVIDEFGSTEIWLKLHTCRANYLLWVKRMEKVNAGLAVIDLFNWKLPGGRFTRGNEQIVFATLDKNSGCGVQILYFDSIDKANVADGNKTLTSYTELAKNDGLSLEDFKFWFKGYDL